MKKFDFVVVGAGTGGSIAAKTAAKQGFNVCLIDRKKKQSIGDKVCGDAVGRHHFENLQIQTPKGDELARKILGVKLHSPDMKTVFQIKGEGFMINRYEFGQRLLNEALDAGAELWDKTTVLEPIIVTESVKGVKIKTLTGNIGELNGQIVIDASGLVAVTRDKLPTSWGIDRKINRLDMEVCYREIRELKTNIYDSVFIQMYFNMNVSPGGYYWIFPKDHNSVNVGLGIQMKEGFPNPKKQLYKYVLSNPLFKDSKLIRAGGGLLSTKRPINCMVGNGIIFVGDSACLTNPVHGGGIGPSMISGKLAVQVACKAIEEENVTQENLWTYNRQYMKEYGAQAAGLDVFRIFLQKCSDEELNYGMGQKIMTEEDILRASLGEDLRLNITEKAKRAFRGIKKPRFLKTLYKTAQNMKRIKALYLQYPQPKHFDTWVRDVNKIMREMQETVF